MDASQFSRHQLAAAFSVIRRAHWPDALDAAMCDEIYRRLIVYTAWRMARREDDRRARDRERSRRRRAGIASPPIPTHQPELLDRKRAAAGDHDE